MFPAPTLPAYRRLDGAVLEPVGGHLFEECAMRHSTGILPSNQATVVGAAGDIKRRAPSQAFLAIAERRGVVRSISLWCVRAALAFRHDEIRAGQVSTLVAIKAKCARQGHSLVAALDRSPFSGC